MVRLRQAFGARGSAFDRRHVPRHEAAPGRRADVVRRPETDAPGGSVPRRGENHGAAVNDRRFADSTPFHGDGGTKGGATYRFRSETAMLAGSGCPQLFASRRDREFESVFLQRRVHYKLGWT